MKFSLRIARALNPISIIDQLYFRLRHSALRLSNELLRRLINLRLIENQVSFQARRLLANEQRGTSFARFLRAN